MKRIPRITITAILVTVAVVALSAVLWRLSAPTDSAIEDSELALSSVLSGEDAAGYARATGPRRFSFPRDHGPHPSYRNEWWYFTGNLATDEGRRFGYELTVFRIAVRPQTPDSPSPWATNQVYMAHFAISDIQDKAFHAFERFARGAAGLAGARTEPFRVWLENWQVSSVTNGFPWRISVEQDGYALSLRLQPDKPVVLHDQDGFSRKAGGYTDGFYYYSLPRLATKGTLTVTGRRYDVAGNSWMDREWFTSALGSGQAGWDWFALNLSDGSDVMFYQLRRADGQVDPHSMGTFVGPDGQTHHLSHEDVRVEVQDWWRSPRGGRYPAQWRIHVQPLALSLRVTPRMANQELDVSVRYWEGAVAITGMRGEQPITGEGYVELTGYAD